MPQGEAARFCLVPPRITWQKWSEAGRGNGWAHIGKVLIHGSSGAGTFVVVSAWWCADRMRLQTRGGQPIRGYFVIRAELMGGSKFKRCIVAI
jgi:hypothetical protein